MDWIVGLYLNGGDLIAGKDRRTGRWLQSTARWPAMGDGRQLADVHGSSDSGHPETSQIRGNDLQALAKSLGYQNGDGEHIWAASPTAVPWPMVRSLRMRRSSAQIDEQRAEEGRGAHHDAFGGERNVQGGSEGAVDGGGDLRTEGGRG